ncbi:phytanoyl-CoA dioxygenase family protein [Candidatus Nitrosotenuis chungbukensis]|uniref:phytanoyl-CoA dioxygenase family protein n=1 Tax=Candidatus Nitrosotenuis chungbukensis TaxID=1353246 RepID=UPI0005B29612|nr:phytanoyl-CoA dioxygenase family protein [Candidatus Nitrosotenuis chungbukensis]
MTLDKAEIDFFNENGYLVLSDFFQINELNNFKNSLRRIILTQLKKASKIHPQISIADFIGKEFDDAMIKFEEIDHQYVADIYDTIYSTSAFLQLSSKKEISECINQLLKREVDSPLYIDQSRCRIDPPFDPHNKKCGWHQEVFYYVPNSNFVQTWAPLIHNATKENGAIEVCVGSHKNTAKQSCSNPKSEKYSFIVDESEVEKFQKTTMELKLGQLLIFNSRLIHRSGNNLSKEVRYSLVGINHDLDNEYFIPPRFIEKDREKKFLSYYESTFKSSTN